MDASDFIRNSSSHSLEELAPYEQKYVAWSEDGKHILACAETEEELYEEITRRGITRCVVSFIPPPDVSLLGGAEF